MAGCANDPWAETRASVVQIVQRAPQEGLAPSRVRTYGTSWVLDEAGWFVASAHAILGGIGSTVRIRSTRGEFFAEVVAIHPELDLALLHCPNGGPWKALALALRDADVEEPVAILGYPREATPGSSARRSHGRVVDRSRRPRSLRDEVPWKYDALLASDALVEDGWSGGPMLDEKSRVVGILVLATGQVGTAGEGHGLPLSAFHPVLVRWGERFGFPVRDWLSPSS